MARRWGIEHRDGRPWTPDELTEIIRVQREHDGTWPYDATLVSIATDPELNVYLLDNCLEWHRMDDISGGDDVRLVFE